ncbi:hypothetical protein [Candidatus Kuenenia stuttgartiensis]|jgi:hypothetical protein|uniref:hypothetical protein n=1 Tax=Kuenenia stuttgartiensis TaxID=174633 RepID=UPI001562BE55|nr:hypothetical protein [Candidatus Kuenenia stuttgartiensis]
MAVEGGFGDRFPIVFLKKAVEAIVAAAWLFFFEFNGFVDNFTRKPSGCATVAPRLSCKRLKSIFAVAVEFSPEGRDSGSFPLSVGEYDLLKAEFFQKKVGLLLLNLTEDDRMQKIAPE